MLSVFRKALISASALTTTLVLAAPLAAQAANVAAAQNAANGVDCRVIAPFYWEIGTATSGATPVASGTVTTLQGNQSPPSDQSASILNPNRNTVWSSIYSASKWIWGAYAMEKAGGPPSSLTLKSFQMLAGHHYFDEGLCTSGDTVSTCFFRSATLHQNTSNPSQNGYDAQADGYFYYSGGNDQWAAYDSNQLNLTNYYANPSAGSPDLTTEVNNYLHLGPSMVYQAPVPSAGLSANAADYASFLQRLLIPHSQGGYVMADYLNPQQTGFAPQLSYPCQNGLTGCSPSGSVAWHYGVNYWIEDNTTGGQLELHLIPLGPGDGSYSSDGAGGFYPWINKSNADGVAYYGMIARKGTDLGFEESARCGIEIRQAFLGIVN